MGRLANFLYIGTAKAGSTWLYHVLDQHPQIYMAPGKALYFFSAHYERGLDWYASQFEGAGSESVVGEVSHTYMYAPEACERIAAMDPGIKLMVCLREPADRTFSDHLDAVKNGQFRGSFEEQLAADPELIDLGRYARHLAPYVARFGRGQLHVGIFDDLVLDPDAFARQVFEFLEVEPRPLSAKQRQRMQPAGEPRSRLLSQLVKKASRTAAALGLRKLRGRVKTSRRVRSALYRSYTPADRPVMRPETRERLRALYRPEVEQLDQLLGTRCAERWGYR